MTFPEPTSFQNLFGDARPTLGARVVVPVGAAFLVYLGMVYFTPWVANTLTPRITMADEPGATLFFRHLLTFSLPHALLSLAAIFVLIRFGALRGLSLRRNAVPAVLEGAAGALVLVLVVIGIWIAMGKGLGLKIDGWGILGNLFSNAYEEVVFRGLLLGSLAYAFRRASPAVLLSALAFAGTHWSYPLPLVGATAVAGLIFGVVYVRTGNLLAPWIAHQLADLVLDSILVG